MTKHSKKFNPTNLTDYGVPSLTNWDMESKQWKEWMQDPAYKKLREGWRESIRQRSLEKQPDKE